ncbi:hypothetical protein CH277_13575 [Rhodococcus sp. 06-469-3-2]|nr:hypothetical protein CH277_13575 [Rhodococcus sp. 06-469-3-2]
MNRLTAAQSAMLFDQIAEPTDIGNNVVASVIVASGASASDHRSAWEDALRRHPVLMSRIVSHDSGFRFRATDRSISVDVAQVPDVRDRSVREDLAFRVMQPFDLFAGPLVRAAVRCDGRRAVVSLVVHHILIDVASAPLILNEYFANLRALEFGESGAKIDPGANFEQFVDAEQAYLRSSEAEADRAYWCATVEGYSNDPLAGLPTSTDPAPDPLEPFVRFEAEPDVAEALRAQAKSAAVSPAALFLAAFQRALAAVSTSTVADIAVGMPVLRRDERHLTTLGSFTQLAVARSRVGLSFDDDLRAAGEAIAGARRHGRLPLSEYAQYADEPSCLTRTTFLYEPSHLAFGTAFVLGDRWDFDLSGYRANPYPVPSQTGQFDLRFQVGLVRGRYVCAVHFGPRYHRAAVLIAEHIRDDLQRISGPASFAFVEPGRSGSGWVHPADRGPTDRPADVIARIGDIARSHPDRFAVSTGSARLTYAELWRSASRVARSLSGRRGELVAVSMPKEPDAVAAILGVMLSGNAFVVVDPMYPEQRRAIMLAGIDVAVVATGTGVRFRRRSQGPSSNTVVLMGVPRPAGFPYPTARLRCVLLTPFTPRDRPDGRSACSWIAQLWRIPRLHAMSCTAKSRSAFCTCRHCRSTVHTPVCSGRWCGAVSCCSSIPASRARPQNWPMWWPIVVSPTYLPSRRCTRHCSTSPPACSLCDR